MSCVFARHGTAVLFVTMTSSKIDGPEIALRRLPLRADAGAESQAELHCKTLTKFKLITHGYVPHCSLAKQRDGTDRKDEAQRHGPNQQRPKLSILSAPHHEDVIEIFRLQL